MFNKISCLFSNGGSSRTTGDGNEIAVYAPLDGRDNFLGGSFRPCFRAKNAWRWNGN